MTDTDTSTPSSKNQTDSAGSTKPAAKWDGVERRVQPDRRKAQEDRRNPDRAMDEVVPRRSVNQNGRRKDD